jgi:hypothetical protein
MTILGRPQTHIIYQRPAPSDDAPLSAKQLFEWGSFVFYEFFLRGGQNPSTRAAAFEIFEAYHTALGTLDVREFVGKVMTVVDSLEIMREARGRDTADGSALMRLRQFETALDVKYPQPRVFVGRK